jgi:hypothetical protein
VQRLTAWICEVIDVARIVFVVQVDDRADSEVRSSYDLMMPCFRS